MYLSTIVLFGFRPDGEVSDSLSRDHVAVLRDASTCLVEVHCLAVICRSRTLALVGWGMSWPLGCVRIRAGEVGLRCAAQRGSLAGSLHLSPDALRRRRSRRRSRRIRLVPCERIVFHWLPCSVAGRCSRAGSQLSGSLGECLFGRNRGCGTHA